MAGDIGGLDGPGCVSCWRCVARIPARFARHRSGSLAASLSVSVTTSGLRRRSSATTLSGCSASGGGIWQIAELQAKRARKAGRPASGGHSRPPTSGGVWPADQGHHRMLKETDPMGRLVRSGSEGRPSHRQKGGSGLLRSHLVVVAMMMVTVVVPVVVTMMMMLLHRGRVGTGGAEDRHGESQRQSQAERGEKGLLHDFVSFLRGRSESHRSKSVTQASR
ncbi:conserved hypothetical protein [Mesorhizobium sp. SOD10]|nr:conserved hypothetical protein [Mesorhizobium sp. SOD10]